MKKKNWLSENVANIIDLVIALIWSSLSIYITAKFLGIIKAQQGVDFSGVLGVYAAVTGLMTQVIQFHRGSSKGSEDKSKQLDALMGKTTGVIEKAEEVNISTQK